MSGQQSFPGSRTSIFLLDPEDLVIIGIDTDDGPEHPLYDERIKLDVDEAMVKNIRVYGVLEPVLVRKNGKIPEVIDGRQRIRAARAAAILQKEAGEEPVKVKVLRQYGDDGILAGVMISANELRQDDSPLQKARTLGRYLAMGRSEGDAAIAFGVSGQSIKNWVRLLEAAPEVQTAVEDGNISASAAIKLGSLSKEEQVKALGELQTGGAPTTNAAAKQTRQRKAAGKSTKPGTAVLRKVIKKEDEEWAKGLDNAEEINPLVVDTIRWILGEGDASKVPGLEGLLELIATEKPKRGRPPKAVQAANTGGDPDAEAEAGAAQDAEDEDEDEVPLSADFTDESEPTDEDIEDLNIEAEVDNEQPAL